MKKLKVLLAFMIILITTKYSFSQFFMSGTGYVSIGSTSNPLTGLQCFNNALFCTTDGSITSAPWIFSSTGSAYSTTSQMDYTWYNDGTTGMYHPASGQISFATSGTQIMNLTPSGNGEVNFYNTNSSPSFYPPAVTSYVDAIQTLTWNIEYWNGSSYNHNFYVYGAGYAYAYSWNTISDARLKKNIDTIHNALSKVLQLRGVTYQYNPQTTYPTISQRTRMGLIAQEVVKVCPEVVDTGKDSVMGIEYQNMVGLLIEAIKTQNKRIDSLATIINNCCNKNSRSRVMDTGTGEINDTTTTQIELTNNSNIILYQNQPNPFTGSTVIRYFIPQTVSGTIYISFSDMYGVEIKRVPITVMGFGNIDAGAQNLVSGVYSYSIVVNGNIIDTKKMVKNQ